MREYTQCWDCGEWVEDAFLWGYDDTDPIYLCEDCWVLREDDGYYPDNPADQVIGE